MNPIQSDLKGKKLLIMGGIAAACDIVRKAKEMGLYVIVTDYYENSPAKRIADESYMVSTTDVEAVVDLCKNKKIDGVITGYIEFMLPYYVEVCRRLGLPCYATSEQIMLTSNKRKFKDLCRNNGIIVPDDYYADGSFKREDLDRIKYPVIVKPVDNGGARGISICNNETEFKIAYNKAREFSKSKEVIIERYVQGDEVRIFYAVQNGEFTLIAMADRKSVSLNKDTPPLPVLHVYPSKYLKKYQEFMDMKVRTMFNSIGIDNGIIFIQALIENNELIVFESGFRLSGAREYHITKLSGVDSLELLIKYAVSGVMGDEIITESADPDFKDYGFIIDFLAEPGKIREITGLKETESLTGVISVCPVYSEGDIIPDSARGTIKQVFLRVFIVVNTKTEFDSLYKKIKNTIKIYSDLGQNMLITEETFDI